MKKIFIIFMFVFCVVSFSNADDEPYTTESKGNISAIDDEHDRISRLIDMEREHDQQKHIILKKHVIELLEKEKQQKLIDEQKAEAKRDKDEQRNTAQRKVGQVVRIELNNGSIIETDSYWEERDVFCYMMFDSVVKINKELVKGITSGR